MAGHPDQQRATMRLDATLCRVARARAADMAARGYFAHTDPDGHGPNWWVERAGYDLPADYNQSSSANNVESLAAGQTSASAAWDSWMGSSAHAQHVLGTSSFYAAQTSVGVGYVADAGSEWKHYWVVISAPASGPEIRIASPTENAKLSLSDLTLTGTTSGLPAPALVEASLGNGLWIAAAGARDWTATLTGLQPGENVVRVRSLNANGSTLDETSRTIRFVASAPLTVQVAGPGSVSASFTGTTQRELGREYTIVATPAAGALFSGWTGSFPGTSPTLAFTMIGGANITANFAPNPFVRTAGKYVGLFASGSVHGQLRVKLGATGAFSAKIRYNGLNLRVLGEFNTAGVASAEVSLPNGGTLTVLLQLQLGGGAQQITGSLSDGTFTAPFAISGATTGSSTHAGLYTFVIPALNDDLTTTPDGDGIGWVLVNANGVAMFSGLLSEGTKVLASGFVSPDGTLALYIPLYEGAGLLTGNIQFRDTSVSDCDGALFWSKPAPAGAIAYLGAFDIQTTIVGSRYSAPAPGVPVLAVPASRNNTTIALGDGDLDVEVLQPTTLALNNTVAVSAPVAAGITIFVKSNSGRFTGSFVHPKTGVTTAFRGVIVQKQNAGFGFFVGGAGSGYATFAPIGQDVALHSSASRH